MLFRGILNMKKIIRVKNLNKKFISKDNRKDLGVLNKINLDLNEGEFIALVGPSGCGKTTFLNILAGLESATSGEIKKDIPKDSIGYMFQTPLLFPWRTVLDNVLLGLQVQNKLESNSKKKALQMLSRYGLEGFSQDYPHILSGGMKQRVAFLRTMIINPKVLLLDEPFSSLDYEKKIELETELYNVVKKNNLSVVFVTHDIDEAIALADKIFVLSKRPARVISSHEISMKGQNPIQRREDKKFPEYFKRIWEDIQNGSK
jgi:NitT/TauT family transport system ATP-binding protein